MLNLLLSLLGTYALICIGARVLHRYFLYLPDKKRYMPREVGLADVEEIIFAGKGGIKLIAWYLPARRGKPTLLYFTGNSGSAANRARKIEAIAASGYGVFMLNYRRFGDLAAGQPRPTISPTPSPLTNICKRSLAWRLALSLPMASRSEPALPRGLPCNAR